MDAQCSPCKIQIISEKATVTQTGKWEMDLLCKYEELGGTTGGETDADF